MSPLVYALRARGTQAATALRPVSPINCVSGRVGGEESDSYPAVAKLNDRWRVIACSADIQWILQRRRGDHWSGYWFCRTREALILGARKHAGEIGGVALAALLRLPARFPEPRP
jgi:hypothetical protein